MKLIICFLKNEDKESVVRGLNQTGLSATLLPSTGAYFRRGNATLMVGVEDDKVSDVIDVVKENCAEPAEEGQKRATIIVLDIDRFEKV